MDRVPAGEARAVPVARHGKGLVVAHRVLPEVWTTGAQAGLRKPRVGARRDEPDSRRLIVEVVRRVVVVDGRERPILLVEGLRSDPRTTTRAGDHSNLPAVELE